MIPELPVDKYTCSCDPQDIGCSSSAEVDVLDTIIGQERAVRALQFGLGIKVKGFNIFASGLPGTGRTTAIESYLEEIASKEAVAVDWCYVNDFHDNYRPNALRLPAGKAGQFRADMDSLVAAAVSDMRTALESEMVVAQREKIASDFQQQKQDYWRQQGKACQGGFASRHAGLFVGGAGGGGKLLSEEEFMKLSPSSARVSKSQQQYQSL
jgi:Cdc6-like AAA superfamily ATPase